MTAAAWAADGESFVTASLDSESQLRHWSMRGQPLYTWKGGFRVQDCAISADGRRLVAADTEAKVHVYNMLTYEEDYCLPVPSKPTSVSISKDSRHVLINLAEHDIQLVDMETTAVVRQFKGQKQGEFVIRSTFGGAAENFVVSGSEGEYLDISFLVSLLTISRFESLHLAQGKWQHRRDSGWAYLWMRELHIMEPGRPGNVRIGRRRQCSKDVRITPILCLTFNNTTNLDL